MPQWLIGDITIPPNELPFQNDIPLNDTISFKNLRFNCSFYTQTEKTILFKIDFFNREFVSSSIYGKDKIALKLKPNELLMDEE